MTAWVCLSRLSPPEVGVDDPLSCYRLLEQLFVQHTADHHLALAGSRPLNFFWVTQQQGLADVAPPGEPLTTHRLSTLAPRISTFRISVYLVA